MINGKLIRAADLFCGAGGTSTGLLKACEDLGFELDLLAINHWDIAIATHTANHPYAHHICENLDNVNPRKAVPSGTLDILIASPECTHHSNARGGRPCSDQSRASAWHVLRWAEALRIDNILIENVKEFQSWGPLGVNGRPLKSRKGETFQAFLNALGSLRYKVDFRVLNAAYYGDPTTRERLFIIARRGRRPIVWPEPTHTPDVSKTLFGKTKPWRTAREIIDWSIPGHSIFTRKKPLSQNTINRIFAGLRKFSGKELEPFIVQLNKNCDARSLDNPLPTIATVPHFGLCKPFLVQYNNNSKPRSVEEPVPTQSTKDRFALCEPFIIGAGGPRGAGKPRGVDKPLNTIMTESHAALVQPFLVGITQAGANSARVRSVDEPMPTIVTKEEFALCKPFIVPNFTEREGQQPRVHDIDKPLPTITSHGAGALVQPKINGHALDIHFRMLQPHELAQAMSFDKDYQFEGNREAQVKQIGNAVPVMLAKALCRSLLN